MQKTQLRKTLKTKIGKKKTIINKMYKILTQIHLNYKFKKTTPKNIHIHAAV